MKRKIIEIDREKCTGCGECVTGCPEGALQIIDGKARLVGDLYCDGLGACIGNCPEGAISVTERESEPYDENRVMENIVKQGEHTVQAHLAHLREHGQEELLRQALRFLEGKGVRGETGPTLEPPPSGCPGSRSVSFAAETRDRGAGVASASPPVSALTHWPVQLHLVSPSAPHFRGKDVVLAADCTAYALGDFHTRYLEGKTLAIACPKLDEGQEVYLEKLVALIDGAQIRTLSVITMEVPCCRGLLKLAQEALQRAARKVPLTSVVVGIRGDVLQERGV
jgi:Pyruvate/2-oxoacid:ferredoxin oxidoreductase delta subunit